MGLWHPPEGRHLKRSTGGVGWALQNFWLQCEIFLWQQVGGDLVFFFRRSVYDTVRRRTVSLQTKQECCRSEWFYSDTTMINRCLTCTCYQRSAFLKRLRKCGQCYYCAFLIGHSVFCIHEKLEINVLGTCIHRKGSGMPEGSPPPQHFFWQVPWLTTACSNFMDDHCYCTRQDEIRQWVELVVGLFNKNLLCANYRVADANHPFSLISPFISIPSFYLSSSQSARLPSKVLQAFTFRFVPALKRHTNS